jgi:O-antigen/teichoic acid export membrane protein
MVRVFFLRGDKRTVKIKKNIIAAVFLKGCSIIIQFLLVPMTLNYLRPYEYGIWLTLSSILMWINYFDIGLGHGLRNKLAEALALDNKELAGIYVSTTFYFLAIIAIIIYFLFLVLNNWIDWYKLLNISSDEMYNLNTLISFIFLFFCVSFVFKIVGVVYLANQLSVINDFIIFSGNVVSLIVIFILTKISEGNLAKVAITYSAAPVVSCFIMYFVTFYIKYPFLRPRISGVKINYLNNLIGLGIQFFFIQISDMIIFSMSNVLVSHLFGAEYVTSYNIVFKYFSVISMIFSIIVTPLWSSITDAYTKNDYNWIKRIMRNFCYIWFLLVLIMFFMIILSKAVLKIWIGSEINIQYSLIILMGIYFIVHNWAVIFAVYLNGIGKNRLRILDAAIRGILFIPLAFTLAWKFGVNGIIGTMCIVSLQQGILYSLQYKRITNKKIGFWDK